MFFERKKDLTPAYIAGAGLALTAAGIGFALARRRRQADRNGEERIDAPRWTLGKNGSRATFGKSLLINRPRDELFAAWQVERFPEFMENVVEVQSLDDQVSRWTIKAPADRKVVLVNRITERVENESISWQSEDDSEIANSGKVRFEDAPAGRGTYVSLILAYDPPGGKVGRLGAKLLQREPEVQARRDLHRFKQLMETGEVTSNASPSARASETPTEPHI
ncbi:SRPBCC family protein [Sphingopyxis sp.]|uniref:SRPBCC family protein n=1 Tax=Sphingopyxis sp. TaxID=1908224 RepID=UPI002D79F9D3|nr:SRPBCC family protein [Sphingopyxis sp.]HET6526881.1 SRPBCC family protein [Sphingopyxis sp.]